MNFSNTAGTNVTAEDLYALLAELKRRYGVSRLSAPMIATIRIIEDAEILPLPRVR